MPLAVQLLVLEFCRTLLACLLVLFAVSLLAIHAAVLDEVAGIAAFELGGIASVLATVCTGSVALLHDNRRAFHFHIKFHAGGMPG